MLKTCFLSFIFSIISFSISASAQDLSVTEKYQDNKNKFSISYIKGFKIYKNSSGAEINSRDKALTVSVKVYTEKELKSISNKTSKTDPDTLTLLKSILASQGIKKNIDESSSAVPEEILSPAKADSGSSVKYDLKKGNRRFVCAGVVFKKKKSIVYINYAILEKEGNERYEDPAKAILRSFSFTD